MHERRASLASDSKGADFICSSRKVIKVPHGIARLKLGQEIFVSEIEPFCTPPGYSTRDT